MKLGACAIGLVLGLASSQPAAARPWRVNQLPNGPVASCLTCHVIPGGPRNAFGTTVESYGGTGFLLNGDVRWGTVAISESPDAPAKTLAQIDSDGDGRTNGEELLDPNDLWRAGQSHPGTPAFARLPALLDAPVVIGQLYIAGGVPGAAFQNDFIELYNRSTQPVSIGGWSIQYAPPNGSGSWGSSASSITVLPSPLTLQPGQSYLVQEASGGPIGGPLDRRDLIDDIAFGDTGGKVVLVNDSTALGCNGSPATCTPAALDKIVDLVGYGTAVYFEGLGAAPAPASTSALTRARNGCTDINNNGANVIFPDVPSDFALGQPTQRGSASTPSVCAATSAVPALGGSAFWILGLALAGLGAGGLRCRPPPERAPSHGSCRHKCAVDVTAL